MRIPHQTSRTRIFPGGFAPVLIKADKARRSQDSLLFKRDGMLDENRGKLSDKIGALGSRYNLRGSTLGVPRPGGGGKICGIDGSL